MIASGQPGNYIKLDGKVYFLERDDNEVPIWDSDRAATQAGDPTVPRWARINDWSRGMGDSRGFLKGAVEYAENAYLGAIGRILPGPLVTEIATAHSNNILSFVDVTLPATRVLAGGGTRISEINPSTQAVATTRTPGGGASVLSMALFIDQVAIALGDSVDFERRNASGTYSANTLSKKARAFGIDNGDLVRGRSYFWSRCSLADFYGTDNWSTEYDIGDRSGNVNQVFGLNRWSYILKDEGLYTFDEGQAKEANVLNDLTKWKSAENRSYGFWGDLIFVPSLAGLYRYLQQGAARPVGLEAVKLAEAAELTNTYPTAMAAFAEWGYVAYYKASSNTTRICLVRRAQDGDTGMGSPFTVVSVLDTFTGKCQAMHISTLTTPPTLYYGRTSGNVGYLTLTRDGLPATYRSTGTVSVRFAPSDFGSPMTLKFFKTVELIGRNATANSAITVKAAMDGGSTNAVGSPVTAFSAGYARVPWTQGSNDSGRTCQLVIEMTNGDGASTPVEVREVQVNYEERPTMTDAYSCVLRAVDYAAEGGVIDTRSGRQIRVDLDALVDGAVVDVVDPWGDTFKGRIARMQTQTSAQRRDSRPDERIPIMIRRLDYA